MSKKVVLVDNSGSMSAAANVAYDAVKESLQVGDDAYVFAHTGSEPVLLAAPFLNQESIDKNLGEIRGQVGWGGDLSTAIESVMNRVGVDDGIHLTVVSDGDLTDKKATQEIVRDFITQHPQNRVECLIVSDDKATALDDALKGTGAGRVTRAHITDLDDLKNTLSSAIEPEQGKWQAFADARATDGPAQKDWAKFAKESRGEAKGSGQGR